jgi:ribosomal subunit interface protein
MKVEFHIKNIVITAGQKSLIEKKLTKLKRYQKNEPMMIDVYLKDETSAEKGGVDQVVEISAIFNHEKIFVREVDDRLMRAFAFAYRAFERQLERFHRKKIDKTRNGQEKAIGKFLRAVRIRK